jgi:hypothetical protein
MPETSRYFRVEESFIKRAKGDDRSPGLDNRKYAQGVISKLLGKPGLKFWYGGSVGAVKFAVS